MIEITINNDPSTIGPEATESDLEAFAEQLATEIGEEFECDVRYRLDSVSRSYAGATDGEYALASQVESRLHEIESGDEWIHVLERSIH